ncbi:MAG: hypothetical protein FWG42_02085 [Clostridiales bacterium]|nr:hypothetical protein [Clostridiales bacterium]
MSIKGGRRHQILYKADARLIDVGDRGIKWNPPSFTLNGKEVPEEALIVTEGYAKIEVKKDQLLKIFGDLKNLTDRAIKNKGYLLHCGI